jgi:hypothetical protein
MNTPKVKPKISRRDVEFHQANARGAAARKAAAVGYDAAAVKSLTRAARGCSCELSAEVTLKPLVLQVQLCLTEYSHLMGEIEKAGLPLPSPEKKLLHYVAFFAEPALAFEFLTDHEVRFESRYRDLDALAFGFAEVVQQPGNVDAATRHIMTELHLLDTYTEDPAPAPPPGKPDRAARPTRPRRARHAAPPQAG